MNSQYKHCNKQNIKSLTKKKAINNKKKPTKSEQKTTNRLTMNKVSKNGKDNLLSKRNRKNRFFSLPGESFLKMAYCSVFLAYLTSMFCNKFFIFFILEIVIALGGGYEN